MWRALDKSRTYWKGKDSCCGFLGSGPKVSFACAGRTFVSEGRTCYRIFDIFPPNSQSFPSKILEGSRNEPAIAKHESLRSNESLMFDEVLLKVSPCLPWPPAQTIMERTSDLYPTTLVSNSKHRAQASAIRLDFNRSTKMQFQSQSRWGTRPIVETLFASVAKIARPRNTTFLERSRAFAMNNFIKSWPHDLKMIQLNILLQAQIWK